MWGIVLAINSFVVVPAATIFLIYSAGHGILTLQWKLFVIAVVLFLISLIVQVVVGILDEG